MSKKLQAFFVHMLIEYQIDTSRTAWHHQDVMFVTLLNAVLVMALSRRRAPVRGWLLDWSCFLFPCQVAAD